MGRTLQKALDEIITQTNKLTFDGTDLKTTATLDTAATLGLEDIASNQINPAKEDGNLATIAGVDFATETTQTDGSQKTQIVDSGGEAVTVTGGKLDVNASIDTSALALESGGNLAMIAGKDFSTETTLALIKSKTDNLDVALSTRTKPTDVQLIAGAVTVNAGTGVDTSQLALESGGSLARLELLLEGIMKELKIMNTHMMLITDKNIERKEIDF